LINFNGSVRDIMTLAHELGHGVHQVLAAPRGHLMCSTPSTLAETASVFGEMLVFTKLLDATEDRGHRRALLAGKIEDMLNTVVRQIGFHNFETRFHDSRKEGELTPDQIADIWMETQSEALGPSIHIDETYRPIWGFIPHFIHVPFYVYAYAFGDCLVNALWQVYAQAKTDGKRDDFVCKYLDLLRAGGTNRHDVALAPFGLDARDDGFWSLGLDMIACMIDEIENLLDDEAL
jgi:oligoendopeptidase F